MLPTYTEALLMICTSILIVAVVVWTAIQS